ncbi:alpha-aminoadipate reductase phosphopantetheinyl transferase Lys7 [Schizosaccharomyces japonicus yFS275]|uniref:holo-[acyl-carrier-protein] synthase n=1 Tax=Schizosaccharomyces japonicus (strain yFS275 / FY16936) TaxID=402676 RepID=B6JZC6_SCHJY|nr:alpha-aminoadipate reductase phosphopantetheinyl transferase Lys7 [Schizosaccharomyces japonicus yFS275]EEB06894.2 alpha-aminoadipate reductase phosphopantetheinyl transferase Lys7 [Schizosaccharomyces japonicus yFS275]
MNEELAMPSETDSVKLYVLDTSKMSYTKSMQCLLSPSMFTPSERARIGRFYFAKDAMLAIASIYIQKRVVSEAIGCPISEVGLSKTASGRPFSAKATRASSYFDYNVSHHGSLVVCVCGWLNGLRGTRETGPGIGVDVMLCEPLYDGPWMEDLRDAFHPSEWETIQTSHNPTQTLFMIWTCKEAVLKATGIGIVVDLTTVLVQISQPDQLEDSPHSLQQTVAASVNFQGREWSVTIVQLKHTTAAAKKTYLLAYTIPSNCRSINPQVHYLQEFPKDLFIEPKEHS